MKSVPWCSLEKPPHLCHSPMRSPGGGIVFISFCGIAQALCLLTLIHMISQRFAKRGESTELSSQSGTTSFSNVPELKTWLRQTARVILMDSSGSVICCITTCWGESLCLGHQKKSSGSKLTCVPADTERTKILKRERFRSRQSTQDCSQSPLPLHDGDWRSTAPSREADPQGDGQTSRIHGGK
jgi:hypothetical protein